MGLPNSVIANFKIQLKAGMQLTFILLLISLTISRAFTFHNASDDNSGHLRFLGRTVEKYIFRMFQREVDCWINNGHWIAHPELGLQNLSVPELSPCHPTYGRKSACWSNFLPEAQSLNYVWEIPSHKCHRASLLPFRVEPFCEVINPLGGNVMIVGDSMNELLSLSMRNMFFRFNLSYPCSKGCTRNCTQYEELLPCWGDSQPHMKLFTVRNDFLSLVNATLILEGGRSYELPFVSVMENHNISLLILNRGAHYVEDDQFLREINVTLTYFHESYPETSIIWRNTPYGHDDYRRFLGGNPLKEPNHHRASWNPPHSYASFERQNSLVRKLLEVYHPYVLYLDVFTPTILRADSHYDMLHYCNPGPVDTWIHLIYNAVMLWRAWR